MKNYNLITTALILLLTSACREDGLLDVTENETEEIIDTSDYSDWTDSTHSNSAEPDYCGCV